MNLFIANWKMYLGRDEARSCARVVRDAAIPEDARVVACPSFVHMGEVSELLKDVARVSLGAQDAYFEELGAYTGEVNSAQAREYGVTYVLAGHSERRRYFGETDEMVRKKCAAAYGAGMQPVVCVGETSEEHARGMAEEVVVQQAEAALQGIEIPKNKDIVIAYEPVWAIGTGVPATAGDAQRVHARIREKIARMHSGASVAVLYGGSVSPENFKEFWRGKDIDGVLVGGASARADTLARLLAVL